jgi:hypothetical protein
MIEHPRKRAHFFALGKKGCKDGIKTLFLVIPRVPIDVPPSSQCVPNIITLLSHMFCPKFSFFQLYKWVKGKGTPFVHRNFNFEEPSKFQLSLLMGQQKMAHCNQPPKNTIINKIIIINK